MALNQATHNFITALRGIDSLATLEVEQGRLHHAAGWYRHALQLININALTAIGIVIYWLLVFSGLFPVEELVPGYTEWFMSFPIADLWIALCKGSSGIRVVYLPK